jgi:mannose-6-phosphate isomerase-like protein (cupin superfamily)
VNLTDTFAVFKPDLTVEPIAVTPMIYEELDRRFNHFKGHALVAMHDFKSNWPTWEKHPAGDEIVVLLSGVATMTLRRKSGDESVRLTEPGSYLVVPKDTWHTALISERTRMLFITPGEGTENRAEL